ncbi:hypothetical protein PS15p_206495 [Mucor circinelloides]
MSSAFNVSTVAAEAAADVEAGGAAVAERNTLCLFTDGSKLSSASLVLTAFELNTFAEYFELIMLMMANDVDELSAWLQPQSLAYGNQDSSTKSYLNREELFLS